MKTKLSMDRLRDRQNRSWDGVFYSVQRIDLLIVSISGAGIYVCLETLKYLNKENLDTSLLIKISGGILLGAILINFISQILGKKSNLNDYLMCEVKLDSSEKISDKDKTDIEEYDRKAGYYDKATNIFNILSTVLMFIGLTLLLAYFSTTF